MAETDTEDGVLGEVHGLLDVDDRLLDDRGVSGSVGQEETVKGLLLEVDEVVVLMKVTGPRSVSVCRWQ